MDTNTPSLKRPERLARALIGAALFLLPLFFIPTITAPFQFGKTMLALLACVVALALFVWARASSGVVTFPRERVLFSAPWILVAASLAATFFSPNLVESLVGRQLSVDTTGFLFLAALMFSLVALLFRTGRSQLAFFGIVLISGLALALFELVHVFLGGAYTSLGVLSGVLDNPFGKWNDLGVYFGGLLVVLLLTFAGFPRRHVLFSGFLYVLFILSLAMLAVVNFGFAWWVVGIFALGMAAYLLYRERRMPSEGASERHGRLPVALSLLVVVVSGLALFSPFADQLSIALGTSHIEARPSWSSTLTVLETTYQSDLIFGSGPNTFAEQWAASRPSGVNNTPFWNADFAVGVGHVVTGAITGGLVVLIAWALFFGAFLVAGARLLFRGPRSSDAAAGPERFAHMLAVVTFFAALYFLLFVFLYVPGVVNTLFAFAFVGLFLATLASTHTTGERVVSFGKAPGRGFAIILALVVLLGAGILSVYFGATRFAAAYYFQQATVAENQDLGRAVALIERADRFATHDQYLRYRARLYRAQLANLVANTPDPTTADQERFRELLGQSVESATAARRYDPAQFQNHLELARTYELLVPLGIEGAYESATAAIDEAIARAPQNPELLLERARIEAAAGNNDAAREYITRALQKKNNYAEAAFLLAQLEIAEGDIGGAIESAEAASVLAPEDATVHFRLGVLYYEAGRFSEAAAAFADALRRAPQYENALYYLALSHDALGAQQEALVALERLNALRPGLPVVEAALERVRAGRSLRQSASEEVPVEERTLPIGDE